MGELCTLTMMEVVESDRPYSITNKFEARGSEYRYVQLSSAIFDS